MQITNKQGLPETVVNAILRDTYDKGDSDYSCTELIDPPRITLLKQRHADEIVKDVTDMLWMLFGKLGHVLAEQAGADNAIIEERLFAEVNGRKISGASDIGQWVLTDGKITDYKFTSVFTAKSKDRIPDWEAQQNIYRWLFGQYGFEVKALEISAFYRDWRPGEALREKDYPPRAEIIPLKVWDLQDTFEYIYSKVGFLKQSEDMPDDKLPICTPAQMWEKPATWAVMKKGNKKASKVFKDEIDAINWWANQFNAKEYSIEVRPGKRVRCEGYLDVATFCDAAPWCNVFQEYKKSREVDR